MKKIIYIIIVLIHSQIFGQDYSKYYKNYDRMGKFETAEKCSFDKLDNIEFFWPVRMKIFKNKFLIIVSRKNNKVIKIYNLSDGELISSFGKIGHGPGEFISPISIMIDDQNNKFGIFDPTKNSITNYVYRLEKTGHSFKIDKIIKISQDAGRPVRMTSLNNNIYVANGMLNSRLCFYSDSGDTIFTNNYIPGNSKGANELYLVEKFRGQIEYNPYTKQIIICNFNSDMIEFYSTNGTILKTLHGPDYYVHDVKIRNNKVIKNSFQGGYQDLCFSKKNLFFLYRRKKSSLINRKKRKMIFMLDRNGNPEKNIKFNIDIWQIDFCDENNRLYALYYENDKFYIGHCKF